MTPHAALAASAPAADSDKPRLTRDEQLLFRIYLRRADPADLTSDDMRVLADLIGWKASGGRDRL